MPGKMKEKMKEILKHSRYSLSGVFKAIYELARYIDEVEKQKEDDEFTSEADKEADLPAIVSGTGGKLPDKEQKPAKKPWLIDPDSKEEEQPHIYRSDSPRNHKMDQS